MKSHVHPDSPSNAAASASAESASAKNSSSSSSAAAAAAAAAVDAYSALITPTKTGEQQQQQQPSKKEKKRGRTQLQLTVEKGVSSGGGATSTVVLKNKHKKKKSSASNANANETKAAATTGREVVKASSLSALSSIKWPPVSSAKSLSPLSGRVADLLKSEQQSLASSSRSSRGKGSNRNPIEFEVNQECTSIGLVPSGRIAIAGFTDGTLRLFDLTGIFAKDKHHPDNQHLKSEITSDSLFDDDASSSDESFESFTSSPTKNSKSSVNSHSNQRYGAVACQIHARGVHTSLLMDVAVSEDGLYAFGGVQRGSVELAAVYLGDVESYLDERQAKEKEGKGDDTPLETPGLLDLIQVDRHADAKLKGFGACTRLWNGWERARNGVERPEYLLFTGKGIKNIHIWSYKPSRISKDEESIWTCLYDTPGNGTSIHQLYFRHNAGGTLQGISKSDDQKLRVWDLNYEQKRIADGTDGSDRPRRPDYVDVASTEGTIGVCGPYAFASGSLGGMNNIINVVGLDVDDSSSPFNCTELALPLADAGGERQYMSASSRPSRTGRQQRGDLKSVVHVAGLVFDAGHALLQLSDGSVVHYSHDQSGHPLLLPSPSSLCTTCIDDASFVSNKRMSLARVGSQGMVLFAVSSFNENTSRGAIMLRALPGSGGALDANALGRHRRYWGFNGLKKKRKQSAPSSKASRISSPEASAVGSAIPFVGFTPVPVDKGSKKAYSSVKKISPSFAGTATKAVEFVSSTKKCLPVEDITSPSGCTANADVHIPQTKKHNEKRKTEEDSVPLEPTPTVGKVDGVSGKLRFKEELRLVQLKTSRLVESTPVPSAKTEKKSNTAVKNAAPEDTSPLSHVPIPKAEKSKSASKQGLPEEGSGVKRICCTQVVEPAAKNNQQLKMAERVKPKQPPLKSSKLAGNEADPSRVSAKRRPFEETAAKRTPVPPTKISKKNVVSVRNDTPTDLFSPSPSTDDTRAVKKSDHQPVGNKTDHSSCSVKKHSSELIAAKPTSAPSMNSSKKDIVIFRKKTSTGLISPAPSKNNTQTSHNVDHPTKKRQSVSELEPMEKRPSKENVANQTPVPPTKSSRKNIVTVRKDTPTNLFTSAPSKNNVQANKKITRPTKKRPSVEDSEVEQMDSQLESIVQGYNRKPIHSPTRSNEKKLISSEDDPKAKKQRIAPAQAKHQNAVVDPKVESNVQKAIPPSSPKRRSRRKNTSPFSSPEKDNSPEEPQRKVPFEESNDSRKDGFLGMTLLGKDKVVKAKSPPESSHQPKQESPMLLVEQLPKDTIGNRLADSAPAAVHQQSLLNATVVTTPDERFNRHCGERQKMAAKHRAEHEMLRRKVLHSIRYAVSTWDVEVNSTKSHHAIVDSAKRWFDEALMSHQEMLDDMLDRQLLESESLAARQTSEMFPGKQHAPMLQVSFPFPEVFEQAKEEMLSILK